MPTQKELRDAAAERLLEAIDLADGAGTVEEHLELAQVAVNALSEFIVKELVDHFHLPTGPPPP